MLQITRLSVQDTLSAQGRSIGFVMSVIAPNGQEFSIEIPEAVYANLVSLWPGAGPVPGVTPIEAQEPLLQQQIDAMNYDEMQTILAELNGGAPTSESPGEMPVPLAEGVADLFSIVRGDDSDEPDDAGESHDEPEEGPPVGGRTLGQL